MRLGFPTRRKFLGHAGQAALLGVAAGVQAPFVRLARADTPLKIGILQGKTGGFAQNGDDIATGINLYLEQAGGKLIGQPCETVWFDDPDPQTGQLNAQKLVDTEKVVALIGGATSATSLAIGAVANRTKVPFVVTGSAAREITGANCNKYTFREGWTIPAASRALAPYLMTISKRWYILVASYVFGADIMNSMTAELKAANGTLLGTDQAPSGTVDFSSYLLKIKEAAPDVIAVGLPPGDMQNFLKQFVELGLDKSISIGSLGLSQPDVWAAGPDQDVHNGLYFATTWYYNNPDNPPAEKAMTALYTQRRNKPPSEKVWEGWYSMKILMTGFENAKSTDSAKVIPAIESLRFDDGNYMRSWDHQMMQRFLIARVDKHKPGADKWDDLDVLKRVPDPNALEALFGSQAEVACKMDSL